MHSKNFQSDKFLCDFLVLRKNAREDFVLLLLLYLCLHSLMWCANSSFYTFNVPSL